MINQWKTIRRDCAANASVSVILTYTNQLKQLFRTSGRPCEWSSSEMKKLYINWNLLHGNSTTSRWCCFFNYLYIGKNIKLIFLKKVSIGLKYSLWVNWHGLGWLCILLNSFPTSNNTASCVFLSLKIKQTTLWHDAMLQ